MVDPLRVITQEESWRGQVKADVVERLRELLAMAESGELQGIAYAALAADGMIVTGCSKSDDQMAIVGGLERIKYRMLAGE